MFEYEWENSSHILLPPTGVSDDDGSDATGQDGLHHLHRQTAEDTYSAAHVDIPGFMPPTFLPIHGLQHHDHHHSNYHHAFQTVLDPRGFPSASYSHAPLTGNSMLSSADFDSAAAFFSTLPKPEPAGSALDCNNTGGSCSNSTDLDRIGLNLGLGGRTYFSAADEDFLSRLYRRSRPFDGGSLVANSPKCQAEGCNADLSNAKHYHRRHKVCEFHSKASTVVACGLTQRFCQQCSRFHMLTEFDNGKRSCRRRLADHNRRRRKSHQVTASQDQPSSQADKTGNSSGSENPPRSPSESSRAHSVSSVTVAVSPSMQESKLNCYNSEASPSVSSITFSPMTIELEPGGEGKLPDRVHFGFAPQLFLV
ncbi:hypothetical protein V2J09_015266 [Rumex salicifolius]